METVIYSGEVPGKIIIVDKSHETGKGGVNKDQKYGEKFFYKWWKKACTNLGTVDVGLYGGTRHSSAVALREHFSTEQIKQGTMHQTNKAFERYFRIEAEVVRNIYNHTSTGSKNLAEKPRIDEE